MTNLVVSKMVEIVVLDSLHIVDLVDIDSCLQWPRLSMIFVLDWVILFSKSRWIRLCSHLQRTGFLSQVNQRTKIVFDKNFYGVINLLTFVVYLHNLDDSIFPCILYFTLQVLLTSIPTRFPNATHTLVKQRHGQNGFTLSFATRGIILLVGHCQILVITNLSRKGEKNRHSHSCQWDFG